MTLYYFVQSKSSSQGNSSSQGLVVIMQGGRPLQIERITFNLEEVISGRVDPSCMWHCLVLCMSSIQVSLYLFSYKTCHFQLDNQRSLDFLNFYLAAPRPTLGHYRGNSLIELMLLTAFSTILTRRPLGAS